MNTDNMSIAGETIDYGPCAFMDAYDPATVFSSIDRHGRYAYANQPRIAHWNLARLAETLLPLIADDEKQAIAQAEEVLGGFAPAFEAAFLAGMRRKLGLAGAAGDDLALAQDFLDLLAASAVDFTLAFRRLADAAGDPDAEQAVRSLVGGGFDAWAARWRARLTQETLDPAAPARADAGGQPGVHSAQPPHRGGDRGGGGARRLRAVRGTPCGAGEAVRRPAGLCALHGTAQEHERVCQTFCGT